MRAAVPYEVNPRQLRALVLLLALLPLVPATFVIRFLIEEVRTERAEARVRAKQVYQQFLTATRTQLANYAWRQIPAWQPAEAGDPWRVFAAADVADTVLLVGARGKLSPPPLPVAPNIRQEAAARLARSLLDSGLSHIALTKAARTRWRFFSEVPEPLFALALPPPGAGAETMPSLLLVTTRRHLLDGIGAYYQRLLDRKSVLRVIDENGESTPLAARETTSAEAGEKLAEIPLPPPLPVWRLKLLSSDATLVDGIMHEQVMSYVWMLGGMLALTGIIAAATGWTLSRRIAFNELSNDALATVAHEMRTPISSIRMLLETLLQGRYRGGPAQVEEYLRLMADENERLERLVGSFQMLGSLGQAHGPGAGLRLAPVRAAEIVEAARARLAPRLAATGCAVQVQIADPPPEGVADAEALTAVMVNLLDNAAKYSEPGQSITVRAFNEGDDLVLEVADQGIGIAAAEQARIFERFYQADRRLARSQGGCGIGLSIVQSVVRLHGGQVSVRSAPGQGSTFSVRIPRVNAPQPEPAPAGRPAFRWLGRRPSSI